jgi:hypothetical protein
MSKGTKKTGQNNTATPATALHVIQLGEVLVRVATFLLQQGQIICAGFRPKSKVAGNSAAGTTKLAGEGVGGTG